MENLLQKKLYKNKDKQKKVNMKEKIILIMVKNIGMMVRETIWFH